MAIGVTGIKDRLLGYAAKIGTKQAFGLASVPTNSAGQEYTAANPQPVGVQYTPFLAAFNPVGEATLVTGATATRTALGSVGPTALVVNTGSVTAYIKFGTSGAVTAATTDHPVPAGAMIAFDIGLTNSWISAITGGTNTNLTISTGTGVPELANGASAGGTPLVSLVDSGGATPTSTPLNRYPTTSVFNRLSVGVDTLRFQDYFNATAQNTARWKTAANLFTFGFGTSGYNVFNASSITTTAAAQVLMSYPTFTMQGGQSLLFEFSEYRATAQATNQQFEAGMFLADVTTTPYTPTDGAYFRFSSTGLIGVLNYNGVESTITLLTAAQLVLNDNTTYRIIIDHYRVEFWGASSTSNPRILLGVLPVPAANGPPFQSLNLPVAFRLYNSGTAGSVVQAKIANTVVISQDLQTATPPGDVSAGMAMMPYQGDNGDTMGTTALYSNSLAPGAGAAMTNTTAALGTGFGGQFACQPSLTANTDGILCSFQNPAPSVTSTGNTIFIKGVRIQSMVTTILVGGPVQYFYSVAFGHTAVSMATAEGVAAKAPRRVAIGMETFPATAAVDTIGSVGGQYMAFTSPIAVMAGEFVAIVAKNVGTVTSSGVITFLVTFDAYMI